MMRYIKPILAAIAIVLSTIAIYALDLPTKKINGKTYCYYVVQPKETIYSLCKRFEISKEEMTKYNPAVADGLKAGMTLYFPIEFFGENDDTQSYTAIETSQIATRAVSAKNGTPGIAVLLPFMLDDATPSQRTLQYTDFYKGILLAAYEQSNSGSPINIYAYDTADSLSHVQAILNYPEVKSADVIIAPNNGKQFAAICDFAAINGNHVVNIYMANDNTYRKNKQVIHANIPREMMYNKAYDYLTTHYKDYTMVFLIGEGNKNDKSDFVTGLKQQLNDNNIKHIDLLYSGELTNEHLSQLKHNQKYLFIPLTSGTQEFRKIAPGLIAFKEAAATPDEVRIFGYPEWTRFNGENLSMLHQLDASIYSRFYNIATSNASRVITAEFNRWYGKPMIEAYPTQGLLGYDLGSFLIKSIRRNNGDFEQGAITYNGVQSAFELNQTENGGMVNQSLYIIEFKNDGKISRKLY